MSTSRLQALLLITIFFSGATVLAETTPRRGVLCIATADSKKIEPADGCIETLGNEIVVEPASESRRFVWRSEDDRRFLLGVVPADEELLMLDGSVLQLRLSGSRERDWPLATILNVSSRDGTAWSWTIDRPDLLRELMAPAGEYDLEIDSPRHFRHERNRIAIRPDRPVSLGTLTLVPHPAISARLLTTENQPVSSVAMLDPEGEALAFSDPAGWIEWESKGELPERVIFAAPELAPRTIDLPQRRVDIDLGTVVLSRGGTLRLTFDRTAIGYDPLEIRLVEYSETRDRDELYVGRDVRRERLSSDASSIDLERLEPRRFALYVRGPDPLGQFAEFVTVAEARVTEHTVAIHPYSLEVEVLERDAPLPGAEVDIGSSTAPGPEWTGRIRMDDRGRFEGTMWQRGSLLATVQADQSWQEGFDVSESEDHHRLRIRLSTRAIEGRVIDAQTHEPLADVSVSYHWEAEDGGGFRSASTDDEGRFSFTRLKRGSHMIVASVPDYEKESVSVDLPGDDDRRTIELALRKAARLYLHVTDSSAQPIPALAVLWVDPSQRSVTRRQMSDTAGLYSLPVEPVQAMRLLIAPLSGSFAYVDVDLSRHATPERPLRVTVPPVAGPLTVRTLGSEGDPRPGVRIDFHYNGMPIPARLLDSLGDLQGVRFVTREDGVVLIPNLPPGHYVVSGLGGRTRYYPEGRSDAGGVLLAGPHELTLVEASRESR